MRATFKPSLSSRASARSLIVACMPAAAIAFVADSPALGSAFAHAADRDFTVADNAGASTNIPPTHIPSTNNTGNTTNRNWPPEYPVDGMRG
jgi:uncharacterized RDD family membrane protein YckC